MATDPYTDGRPLRDCVRLYDNLPPGIGSLLDLATVLIHRAFASYRTGNLAVCDAFLNEGLHACGDLFGLRVKVMTEEPGHVEDRAWLDFLVHLAAVVPAPKTGPPVPSAPPPRQRRELRPRRSFRPAWRGWSPTRGRASGRRPERPRPAGRV